MSVFVIIIGCYTAIGWIADIIIFIMSVAFVVVKYFLHLHDWWISSSPLICLVCHRLIISLPWLHNFIAGRLHLHWWLTWLPPTGFFASTAVQLHHFWLVSLSSLPLIFLPPLLGNIISILVVLSLCQLRQLPSMDNCDYDRRTSYVLRGSSTQAWGLYLQFGLVPDTFHMDS